MIEYPELEKLKALQKAFQLSVRAIDKPNHETLFLVEFSISDLSWKIYIDDEYSDFDENNQLLCVFLLLRALEDYGDATDFTVWCKHHMLDAANSKWLDYYRSLDTIYQQIESRLGKIDSCISSMDYQLRSGAFHALVNTPDPLSTD